SVPGYEFEDGFEVNGGESHPLSPVHTVNYYSLDHVRAVKELVGLFKVTVHNEPAYPVAADLFFIHRYGTDNIEIKALLLGEFLQHFHVAHTAPAKPKVISNDHTCNTEGVDQDIFDETLRWNGTQMFI